MAFYTSTGGLSGMRITANQVTVTRILLIPLPVWCLYQGTVGMWAAVVLFIALGVTDYVDGYLARKYGSTEFGAFLDPISDKMFMTAQFLPVLHLGVFPLWPVALIFIREFWVTELRTVYNLTGASFSTSAMGKYKTNVQGFAIAMALINVLLAPYHPAMAWLVLAATVPFYVWLVYTYIRYRTMHPYIVFFVILFTLIFPAFVFLSVPASNYVMALAALFFAAYSGAEYFVGGWSHFRDYVRRRPLRRLTFLIASGVLVPAIYSGLMVRGIHLFWVPIVVVSLEFLSGGLDNYLTMRKTEFSPFWKVVKLVGLLATGLAALVYPALDWLLWSALGIAVAYTAVYLITHRREFAAGSKPVPAE